MPEYASSVNVLEIEIGVLRGRCPDRHSGHLKRRSPLGNDSTASETRITWMFTTEMGRRVMSAVQRYLVPFCAWRGSRLACRNAGDTLVEGAQPTSFGAVTSRAAARRNICRARPVTAVTYPLVSWQW